MGLEKTTTIAGLVQTNPEAIDPVYEGPDHIQTIKAVLKRIFPGSGGQGFNQAITAVEADLNASFGLSTNATTRGKTLVTIINDIYSRIAGGGGGGGGGSSVGAFPVGSVFISMVDTNPSALLGYGSWSRIADGRFLVGVDANDPLFSSANRTGGSKHSIIPSHTHEIVTAVGGTGAGSPKIKETSIQYGGINSTSLSTEPLQGSAQVTNANLPPFLSAYIWKRDA